MKKEYSKPAMRTMLIAPSALLEGSGVYTDDPQKPGSALSRRHDYQWDDDSEE